MPQHLISIIIPIYNVEKYLRRCLDSVITQTYTNLEIILIDDGSPDTCPQICDEYAAKDNRIIVIHKVNGGLSDARNVGTNRATGEYIFYLDSDDQLFPDSINKLVAKATKTPDSEIIIGEIKPSSSTNHDYDNLHYRNIESLNNNNQIRQAFYRIKNRFPVNAVNKLIKRDFIIRNNISFKEGLIHEDELWMFFVAQHCKKIIFLHQPTYIRYINPGSITTGTPREKKNLAWGIIINEIFDNLSEPNWEEQFFTYSRLLVHFYSPAINKEIYKRAWEKNINLAYKHNMPALAFLTQLYIATFPLLKGHGIGFIIWFITKFIYKQDI